VVVLRFYNPLQTFGEIDWVADPPPFFLFTDGANRQ
jgi:hypothetical protein